MVLNDQQMGNCNAAKNNYMRDIENYLIPQNQTKCFLKSHGKIAVVGAA